MTRFHWPSAGLLATALMTSAACAPSGTRNPVATPEPDASAPASAKKDSGAAGKGGSTTGAAGAGTTAGGATGASAGASGSAIGGVGGPSGQTPDAGSPDTANPPVKMDAPVDPPRTPDAAVPDTAPVVVEKMDMAPPPPPPPPEKKDTAPPPPPPLTVPTNGLVGFWKMDETTGAMAPDSSTNQNDGALVGGGTWGTGKVGNALALASGQHVAVPPSASVDGLKNGITLAAWVYRPERQTNELETVISRQEGDTPLEQYALFVKNGDTMVAGGFTVGTNFPVTIPVGTWVHLALTWDSRTLRGYCNGIEVGAREASATFSADTAPLIIGGNRNGPEDGALLSWTGSLDQVLLYSRALSAGEVADLAK